MRLGVLGGLEVLTDDGVRIELPTQKLRSLLALLVIEVDRVVPVDRIIDQLWGDQPPATATGTLQAYVSHLRRLLEPDRLPRQPPQVLVTQPPGYALRVPPENVDAVRFTQLVERGEQLLSTGSPDGAEVALAEALALWRGAPLADLAGEAFILPEITRLTELRAQAWEHRIEAWLLLGRNAAAAAESARLVGEHPLRERLWGLRMISLYRAGRQAEALRAYQECRRVLQDDLGLEPGPELRRIEQAILSQELIPELQGPSPRQSPPAARPPEPSEPQSVDAPSSVAPSNLAPLVGREPQMRRLIDRLQAAKNGHGGVVLVEGEPGIGKTRLVEEVARLAEQAGLAVAWSRCAETAGAPPFWPWIQVLRAIAAPSPDRHDLDSSPSVASLLGTGVEEALAAADPAGARFRLSNQVVEHLVKAAATRPLLIVIDDLHWADGSSRQLLEFVAGHTAGTPVLIVATFRTSQESAEGLEELLGALARERGTERLPLGGLSVGDVGRYLELAGSTAPDADLAAALHQRTEGNPFFLIELVRLLTSEKAMGADQADGRLPRLEVPASVRDVIYRRMARLPEDTQTVLRVAAVIGREFDIDLLAAASALDVERLLELLEPALATGLVVDAPDSWSSRFSHALLPEALYGSLTRLARARIHRRVGEALEAMLGPHDNPRLESRVDELAHHFYAALPTGAGAKAVRYARRAAEVAERNLAYDEAVRYWQRALMAIDPAGVDCQEQRYNVLLALSQAQRRSGVVRAAGDTLAEAMAIARSLGDSDRVARAAVVFGGVTLWNWRAYGESDPSMISLLEELVAGAAPEHTALRAQLLGTLAVELYYTDQRERREAAAWEAVHLARQVGDAALLGRVLNNCHIALWLPDREDERRAVVQESLAMVDTGLPKETEVIARLHGMWSLLRNGEVTAYDAELATCERLAAEVGVPELRGQVLHGRTGIAILAGRWDEAEALSARAMERLPPTSVWGALWARMVQLFWMRREQGRLDDLLPELLALSEEAGGEPIRPTAVLALACLGRHDEARDRIGSWGCARPFDWSWDFSTAQWAEISVLTGVPDAETMYADLLPYADQVVVAGTGVTSWGSTRTILGLLAHRLGGLEEAYDHLVAAVAHNHRLGARPFEARARYHLARLLTHEPSLGDGEDVRELLRPAQETARRVGMHVLVADISALGATSK